MNARATSLCDLSVVCPIQCTLYPVRFTCPFSICFVVARRMRPKFETSCASDSYVVRHTSTPHRHRRSAVACDPRVGSVKGAVVIASSRSDDLLFFLQFLFQVKKRPHRVRGVFISEFVLFFQVLRSRAHLFVSICLYTTPPCTIYTGRFSMYACKSVVIFR